MAVADRDELWEVKCQCIYCRDQPCAQYLSVVAKPGEAMPGPYSSLMVLRRRASRSGAGRAVRGRKTRDSAVSGTAPVLPQSTMCCHKAPLAISRGGRSEALGRSLCVIRVGIHQW